MPQPEEMMRARRARHRRGVVVIAIAVTAVAVLVPAFALAHIERASYWPNPAPDTSVKPAAGGSIPAVRKVFSCAQQEEARQDPGRLRADAEQGAEEARQRQAALQEQVDQGPEQGPEEGAEEGLQAPRVAAGHQDQEEEGQEAPRLQHQAAQALWLHLDPGRGHRLPQQRPGRDPAGPLHRAEVAGAADQRPRLRQPARSPTTRARRARSPTHTRSSARTIRT